MSLSPSPPSDASQLASLSFHHQFSEPVDAHIFQAADETAFRFPLDTLCVFSSFFRDIKCLSATHASQAAATIPLLSATSRSLAYTFGVITSLIEGRNPPKLPSLANNPTVYEEVVATADAYDLPVVLLHLVRAAKAADPPPKPFMLFTLAVMCKRGEEIADLSLELLVNPVRTMDPWSEKTLRSKHPLALLDLYSLYPRFENAVESFGNSALTMAVAKAFPKGCLPPSSCHSGAKVCPNRRGATSMSQPFTEFLSPRVDAVKTVISANPSLLLGGDFALHCEASGCERCDRHASDVIKLAIQQYIPPLAYTLVV